MLTFACSQYDENFHGSGGVLAASRYLSLVFSIFYLFIAAVLHECGPLGGPPILILQRLTGREC